jgi:hypothetical protein
VVSVSGRSDMARGCWQVGKNGHYKCWAGKHEAKKAVDLQAGYFDCMVAPCLRDESGTSWRLGKAMAGIIYDRDIGER